MYIHAKYILDGRLGWSEDFFDMLYINLALFLKDITKIITNIEPNILTDLNSSILLQN